MRIAIAPNTFRGSLTAFEAVECIADGLQKSLLKNPELIKMPLADGGDGTLNILVKSLDGQYIRVPVTNPLGSRIETEFGLIEAGETAVIEMARASGIELIPTTSRNPMITTTYGTGELIRAAIDQGCKKILIGLGGSATVDGGAGCFQALGAHLLDENGDPIPRGGGGLARLAKIENFTLLDSVEVIILSDVTNPLLGELGASRFFGPQKGADPQMVEQLESNLTHFARIIQRDLGIDVAPLSGGGAAGGFGAGLVAFLGAKIRPGGEEIIRTLNYEEKLQYADVVITGEGKLDSQTTGGKAVQCITQAAAKYGTSVIALAGRVEQGVDFTSMGIHTALSIVPYPCSLDEAITNAKEWLTNTAQQIGNLLALTF